MTVVNTIIIIIVNIIHLLTNMIMVGHHCCGDMCHCIYIPVDALAGRDMGSFHYITIINQC
jgi:hypothetical protein